MASKREVRSKDGIVAASQPLAVEAGLEILRRGGSAIDAAIAVSAAICVVEPGASHLGGDAFVITHDGNRREQLAFNGSGEAPHRAFAGEFKDGIPGTGYRASTIPGLVSTWFAAHDQGGRIPISELLAPAIRYAKDGFAIDSRFKARIDHQLKSKPDTQLFDLLEIDTSIKVGETLLQPLLAASLEEIAKHGRSAFYEGVIADRLVASTSGWFSSEDLRRHRTRVSKPLTINYRGYLINGQPPPSQGMILLEELLIAEGFELANLSLVERIHIMVEAKKIAFADRYELLGDPEFIDPRLEELFSDGSILQRRERIDKSRANNAAVKYHQEGSDTTYFLTSDRNGNAVSWIQSVFHSFGSSWAIPGTGIVMNNRLTGFSIDPRSPNHIAPGRRPAHTLNAWIATKRDGSLYLVGGTPGANIQVQTNFQLIVNAIDLQMGPQENVEAPRWQHLNKASESDEVENFDGILQIEDRIDKKVISELEGKGHQVSLLSSYGHGSAAQLLQVESDGTYRAGSDPRAGGLAAAVE